MLANAGKHHQHWPMSPNCQKNSPLGPTPETKKFESSKKFQVSGGSGFFFKFLDVLDHQRSKLRENK